MVLDRTEWHFGQTPVNVLMVGIAHKGITFPISWTVLPGGGNSSADDQCRALRRFFAVVDPSDIEVVLADREFVSAEWLRWLHAQEVPFVVRLVLRRIGSPSGESDERFLILATSRVDPEKATTLYRQRWEIETMFAALKSQGYRLEKTHLTAPDRIRRLVGLLALAFCWTHLIGERRARRHGPPREKSHGRRQRSLFRYGLDWIRGILTTPEPQGPAFFDCLRGLRSPNAFLSCT